ncbi:S-4TM family putative pore-forming effector [Devosia riboflavina]
MHNNIPVVQEEEAQLRLLRARTQTYDDATKLLLVQLGVTVAIPVVGSIATLFQPDLRVYFAALALVVLLLDPLWIDRWYKRLLKRAAKIAERFDTTVLELPWNQFVVGDEVETEDVHQAAKRYSGRHDDSQLVGWYPRDAGEAPLHLGRLICQRTNLRYDSQLRRNYSTALIAGVAVIAVLVFGVSLARNDSSAQWVLTLTPMAPLLGWSVREYFRQRDTADQLEDLMKAARKLWQDSLTGTVGAAESGTKAREFQDAIFARRVSSALIVPLVYKLSRPRLEDEMNEAASDFLKRYREHSGSTDAS